jgi:hypothetical protein
MSGFSAQWLDLREPVDHRSRNVELGRRLARHFEGWRPITVVDLGCGTGSNLRATAPLLGPDQSWTLVDYDQALLDAAAERLAAWADGSDKQEGRLILFKGAKRVSVEVRRADIAGDSRPRSPTPTSSPHRRCSTGVGIIATSHGAPVSAFYTVLTYDGDQRWTPSTKPTRRQEAFHAHQRRDKGWPAGPDAPDAREARQRRHRVRGRQRRLGAGDEP